MKNIDRLGVNCNNEFILENKKCAKITMKKIELNYILIMLISLYIILLSNIN